MRLALPGIAFKTAFSIKSFIILTLAATIGLAAMGTSEANSKYAAVVIDANTGKTLYESNADSRRYPASLTKMMTLYLTFEALSMGKIRKDSDVVFSKNAAAEPPTKIGVKAGNSISVENAILSLITRSANDASTALAEMIGGSEENFARMMTAKARGLGMKGTVFRNANGLPNTGQFTTARDMATLGIALKEHFPQYYGYFSTRSFTYGRQRIANHNKLLGRIKGVDGIKTGYTRASGFNLVSSVSEGNRNVIAVVLGGTSGASRDNQMASLLKTYMPKASTRDGGPLVAKASPTTTPVAAVASVTLPKSDAPTPDTRPELVEQVAEVEVVAAKTEVAMAAPERFGEPSVIPFAKAKAFAAPTPEPAPAVQAYAGPATATEALDKVQTASVAPSGWAIQVASSPSKSEAQDFLAKTSKQAPKQLASADGFTVPFEKGGVTYYRARFGGFGSKEAAWNACSALKKKKIACYAIEQ